MSRALRQNGHHCKPWVCMMTSSHGTSEGAHLKEQGWNGQTNLILVSFIFESIESITMPGKEPALKHLLIGNAIKVPFY